MVTRKKNKNKNFWVIAYDITDNLRRSRIVKIIEQHGVRVNYSVFERLLTDAQLERLQEKIAQIMLPTEDSVIYYPLCLDCYSKIRYYPRREIRPKIVTVI